MEQCSDPPTGWQISRSFTNSGAVMKTKSRIFCSRVGWRINRWAHEKKGKGGGPEASNSAKWEKDRDRQ